MSFTLAQEHCWQVAVQRRDLRFAERARQWQLKHAKHLKPFTLWCILLGWLDFDFLPTNGFSIKPLKVKLLGEQKATEYSKLWPDDYSG